MKRRGLSAKPSSKKRSLAMGESVKKERKRGQRGKGKTITQ